MEQISRLFLKKSGQTGTMLRFISKWVLWGFGSWRRSCTEPLMLAQITNRDGACQAGQSLLLIRVINSSGIRMHICHMCMLHPCLHPAAAAADSSCVLGARFSWTCCAFFKGPEEACRAQSPVCTCTLYCPAGLFVLLNSYSGFFKTLHRIEKFKEKIENKTVKSEIWI